MPSIENHPSENGETRPQRGERRMSRAARLKQMAEVSDESIAGLEQIFEAKLAAIKAYERQMAAVTDPYARRTLQQMIRQERRELMNLTELIELVEAGPEMGGISRARRRLNHQLKATTGKDAGFWLGAMVVGALLLPGVREKLRPLAVRTVQGVMELSDQMKGLMSGVKEDLEDLVSEAQFEKLRESIDAAIAEESSPPGIAESFKGGTNFGDNGSVKG